MRRAAAVFLALAASALLVRALARPPAPPRPPVIRLAERLAEARRVVQDRKRFEPETLHLRTEQLQPPPGFRRAPADAEGAARFVADRPTRFALKIDVPIEPGRDYVIRAMVRDPSGAARLMVEHVPTPEQPEHGWHRATDERAKDGRVRFDWREDAPPGRTVLTLGLEAAEATDLTLERLTVREAGVRDPSLVQAGPAVALDGLVERPIDGIASVSARGVRRLERALLASDGGVYEWALPEPPPARFEADTATLPRWGVDAASAIEMRVEVETPAGWRAVETVTRGGGGDGGGWRRLAVALPRDARALRLATRRAAGDGRPAVVLWGNPVLRDAPEPARPHVLLVTLDAVRPDHLGAYGYARPTSPFLDALAAAGARFDDVTAQRGHTWASTTSLVSGLLPETTGVVSRGARSHRGVEGVASAFARAGYTTLRIGSPDMPRGQIAGFDFAELADYDKDILQRLVAVGRALDDRPLFIWLHLANAHYPWRVADEFNRFDPGYAGPYRSGLSRAELHALLNAGELPEAERRHLTALYDGAILQMDARLREALGSLQAARGFSEAILAVTADHGAHFGEHGVWFMQSTPFRASLRVPLILAAPGRVPAGVVVPTERGRALLVDVGPTLLDLAGVPADGLDGVTLRPLLQGGRLPSRTTVTHFQPARYVVVENDRYELFYNPEGEPLAWPGELKLTLPLPRLGLYDRLADPHETRDLSLELPLVAGALKAEADAQSATQAPALSTEARQLLKQAGYAEDD